MNAPDALQFPPVRWRELAESADAFDTQARANELDSWSIAAARQASYLHARTRGQDHNHAVQASNRCVRAVAKALGYTYPKSHELSF